MTNQQLDMYGNSIFTNPTTQGIKYAGSKLKIIPYIIEILSDLKGVRKILDGFTGTTRVAQALAQLGYDVTASDISAWSEVFANCYLKSDKPDKFYQDIIDSLNSMQGYDGWYTKHYGGELTGSSKRPFQAKNTRKLDAIRDEIERLDLEWVDSVLF